MTTTVYINGKRVTKEEIAKIEIRNETVKRMFAEKLSGASDNSKGSNISLSKNKVQ